MKREYEFDIKITTTPNGDKVLTMSEPVLVRIINNLYDAHELQEHKGYTATAQDTMELWKALYDKDEASEK